MRVKTALLIISFAGIFALCGSRVFAVTYTVDPDGTGDYPTIQTALDAAVNGDEIVVYPGRYFENINFGGNDIILRSTDPQDPNIVDATIIDANGSGSVVIFSGSETAVCKLAGFTMTSGSAYYGGGVLGNYAKATIEHCVITGNTATYGGGLHLCDGVIQNCTVAANSANENGGGLYVCNGTIQDCVIENNAAKNGAGLGRCNGTIINCTIKNNTGDFYGGGLHDCDGTIQDCTIADNEVDGYAGNGNDDHGRGGGLSNCDGTILNCTIVNNYADSTYPDQGFGGGLYNCDGVIQGCTIAQNIVGGDHGGGLYGCDGTIQNCIVWANRAYGDISLYQMSSCATPIYTCIQDWTGEGTGNISHDPLFIDMVNDDYHLSYNSPCINAGDPSTTYEPEAIDIDGDPRFVGNIDMGVDEVYIDDSAGLCVYPTAIEFVVEGIDSDIPIQTLNVFNCGTSDLNWSITNDCDWLDISPVAGQTGYAQTSEITIGINNDYIRHGVQICHFQISAPSAANNPVLVQVSLRVFYQPGKRYVPAEYPTIQSAVDAVDAGYEIIVSPGRYYERIRFRGEDIVLRSENPEDPNVVAATIIDANSVGTVVHFDGPETPDCVLSGFTITGGHGIYVGGIRGYTNATIRNCVIVNNVSYYYTYAGGIYQCHGLIENCTIDNNSTDGLRDCDGTIRNCVITNNHGGLDECDGIIENCIISNNSASSGGGLRDCDGEIRDCVISDNTANAGGGLDDCDGEILRCKIFNNRANYSGGGLSYCSGSVLSCEIANNSAAGDGGGLYKCHALLKSCMITNNSAGDYGGGLSQCNGSEVYGDVIQNCTIAGNTSGISGGGLYECEEIIRNCIIWGNTSASNDQLYNCSVPSYSCIQDWPGGGTGNFNDHPLFVNDAAGDYHLSMNSPCINKGGYYHGYRLDDIDGDPRFVGKIDTGADEVYVDGSAGLCIYQTEIEFIAEGVGSNMPSQAVDLFNCGTHDLNWSITNDCDWLNISPDSGLTGSTQTSQVDIEINNAYISYGSQTCRFTISDPNAVNSPQTFTVTLDVLRPEIGVVPSSLGFECDVDEPNTLTQVLAISNSGYDVLNWQISEDCEWLSVSPASGQCVSGPNEVTLAVDTAGLEIGFYDCQLTIADDNASNSPVTLPVSLHVFYPGERHVPTEYPTIQQAIDAAVDGDHVIIHPGRYYESCRVYENIIIRSINPDDVEIINSTILNGIIEKSYNSEARHLSLEGLTLNGKVSCSNASPVIRNCIINAFNYPIQAPVKESAHAISIYGNRHMDDAALIQNCLVNIYGEISFYVSNPITVDNGKIEIINSTIAYSDVTYNSQLKPVGGVLIWQSDVLIKNSIIWKNRAINDVQIAIVNNSSDLNDPLNSRVDVSYSDVEGGEENIFIFPDYSEFDNYCKNGVLPDPNFIDPDTLTWGPGNMDADPLFVREPNDGGDGWIPILNPAISPDYSPLYNNDYGNLHLKSESSRFVWDELSDSDFNMDGQVDLVDFAGMAEYWGLFATGSTAFYPYDLYADGTIDLNDFVLFCKDYLQPRVFGAWVTDDVTSPCIDAGDPNDMGWQDELWPHGGRINMGAYGGTTAASMSLSTVGNPADLNHDDAVDLLDWGLWSDDWGAERILLDCDFDRNNSVDSNDLGIFLDNWLWAQ